jgi:hypothetical protein
VGLASVERIHELLPHLHGHARQPRCELLRDAQPPAMMIAVEDASGIAIALITSRTRRRAKPGRKANINKSDFELTVKVKSKKCYGYGWGCDIEYKID